MTELLTATQMRAIEQAAIESGEVTGLELMERAGAGVVEAVFEEWPELSEGVRRAVVLCGPGNNGGDGFVVARLLADRGWTVDVFLYGDPEELPPDAKTNCERWCEVGQISDMREMRAAFETMDLFVDGGFGTGLRRALPAEFQDVFQWQVLQLADRMFSRNVAIDVPSGICSDSGKQIGPVSLVADLIVTFHRAKVGVYMNLPFTPDVVRVKPIGLNETLPAEVADAQLVRLVDVAEIDRANVKKHRFQHKFDHGHALILTRGRRANRGRASGSPWCIADWCGSGDIGCATGSANGGGVTDHGLDAHSRKRPTCVKRHTGRSTYKCTLSWARSRTAGSSGRTTGCYTE